VQFVAFLRSERQFAGLDELKDQLQVDIAHARAAVATHLQ
jgi:FAD synthase